MSLRARLLKWLVIPLVLLNLLAAGIAYWLAWIPAQSALDQSLADAAWALVPHVQESGDSVQLQLSKQAEQVLRVDHFDQVFFVVRDMEGTTIAGDADFPELHIPEQMNVYVAYLDQMRGEQVRAITLLTEVDGEMILIGVAETRIKRQQIRLRILWALLGVELLLLVIVIAVIWLVLDKGFLPLRAILDDLARRRAEDLSPLQTRDAPQEIAPFLVAMNDLLERAQRNARAKQDFLANVAHQLRTPLAGFRAQLEWLQTHHKQDDETAHSTALMLASTDRMVRQANQLLALARSEPGGSGRGQRETLRLDQLVSESVQQFVQQALKKDIDIGFDLQPTEIVGDRFLLRDLLDNLVDNAIRYTPAGGVVNVGCLSENGQGVLTVEDNGPGIPDSERDKVFTRFYRLDQTQSGSGLGLAIVRDIASDHGASIAVGQGANGRGTAFRVCFPAAAQQQAV